MNLRPLVLLFIIGPCPFCSADPVTTISKEDILGGRARVFGELGVPIEEYVTVEGVPVLPSKTGRRYPSFEVLSNDGIKMLEVYKVNGTPLLRTVVIRLSGENKFIPANVYILRGYQTMLLGPFRPDPEGPKEFDLPQVTEPFPFRFVPTKLLKAETR